MSLSRANTQMFKAIVSIAQKLDKLEEEKAARHKAIDDSYKEKGEDLQDQFKKISNALKSFDHTDESIAEFLEKNGARFPDLTN